MSSFASELSLKAMPGISVQICTEVENRKLPQKIHSQPPYKESQVHLDNYNIPNLTKATFLLKHELSSLNYTIHINLIRTKFSLK